MVIILKLGNNNNNANKLTAQGVGSQHPWGGPVSLYLGAVRRLARLPQRTPGSDRHQHPGLVCIAQAGDMGVLFPVTSPP